ncbi:hypothetical protein [Cellulomonas sp. Y8]|uniref:hypothetical protein n=1 Tax=Cellulomonas sp. Y8 TaxID=2591145 RepID=UPI003D756391
MRTRAGLRLAERALARLVTELGEHATGVTVIGGLNADLLTEADEVPHQGTLDVDLHIQVGLVYERDDDDFGWLEDALVRAQFAPVDGTGWRWVTRVDELPVVLDLLCDVLDNRDQEIPLPGCEQAGAMNLPGPSAAAADAIVRTLQLDTVAVAVRFADLGGYLLAKASAAFHRGKDKDFYDLGFVLLHNTQGGPVAAGRAAARAVPARDHVGYVGLFRAALTQLADATVARTYAEQRRRDGDSTDVEVLTQDAIGAALACLAAFETEEARKAQRG